MVTIDHSWLESNQFLEALMRLQEALWLKPFFTLLFCSFALDPACEQMKDRASVRN
jgi:hypothetical protein